MKRFSILPALSILIFTALANVNGQDLSEFKDKGLFNDGKIDPYYDYDHIPDFTYDEVNERVKLMESDMSFGLNETIYGFIDYFTVRNRSYTKMVLARKEIYFPLFEEALERHNMPEEIKFLAIVESGLNPTAKSRMGAMGLWQFMPATGREFQLYANEYIDDRMDPELATEAALKYLKALYRRFGDWELALAAYNCGPGNVNKAIRKSGGQKNFWAVYNHLPRETRSYIPQFQAIMYVFKYADEHNFILEEPTFLQAFEKVSWNAELDLNEFAQLTSICIEDLEQLNPSILSGKIPASRKDMAFRIPKQKVQFLADNQDWIKDSLKIHAAKFVVENKPPVQEPGNQNLHNLTYRVKQGDVLGKIARQYNISVTNLKEWNNLNSNIIKVGQVLHIQQDHETFEKTIASSDSKASIQQDGNKKTYTVQPGDSLWLISRKLEGVSIEQLKKLNNLRGNQIKPGQKLIIG